MEKNGTFFFKNGKERNVLNGKERGAQPWPAAIFKRCDNQHRHNISGNIVLLSELGLWQF